jgi:hypothetical protein
MPCGVVVGYQRFGSPCCLHLQGEVTLMMEAAWTLGIFLFTIVSRRALGPTQPPVQWVPGALSLGVKRPGREADHSPPSSAEVKNAWNYTATPLIRLHGVVLKKSAGKFLPLPYWHLQRWYPTTTLMKMEATWTSETVVSCHITQCHNPEDWLEFRTRNSYGLRVMWSLSP